MVLVLAGHCFTVGIFGYKLYQVALLLCAGALALAAMGAGAISIDAFTLESGRQIHREIKMD